MNHQEIYEQPTAENNPAGATLPTVQTFLQALWPAPESLAGDLTIDCLPSRIAFHAPIATIKGIDLDDIGLLRDRNGRGDNVYFGLGLRREGLGPREFGKTEDIVAIPGFAIDVDLLFPGAHKSRRLPRTGDEVAEITKILPPPTLVVWTGYGMHIYWRLKEPIFLRSAADRAAANRASRAFQAQVIRHADGLGFDLDDTHSIQRIWRLPGFKNLKLRGV